MLAQKVFTEARPETKRQFLAWAADVPYLVTFEPAAFGIFDLFLFIRADDDFTNTLADTRRIFTADPADVDQLGPEKFIEGILNNAVNQVLAEAA
ncbi:hypothetical protein [Magnetospira sp. QH-2]|uniref:hypothetical protein n=1 Tax=Magnetospira sp. (strain QH-2) TaxID=1288970 RepID=UPI0003E81922|nr:hypothetical protein [Magnetospira sp. QH-2]CCQ75773.1 Protein of unknown function [Magnetospira sp. QH-2]